MPKRVSSIVPLVLMAVLLIWVAGCSRVKRENYDKVQAGMTIDQVKGVLGEPTETKSGGGEVLGFGATATKMTWKSGDKTITVIFVDDKVVKKDMSNL